MHYAMSLRTAAPCLQTLKHLFSLLPWKLHNPQIMKKKTEDQRGGQFAIGPTAGQEGLRPATHWDPRGFQKGALGQVESYLKIWLTLIPGHYLGA